MNPREALRPLESRVTLSYLTAFALVLVVFSIAVHLAFATDIAAETSERLAVLVREGQTALEVRHGRFKIDRDAVELIAPASESLSWYDHAGTLVRRIGAVDPSGPNVGTSSAAAPSLALADVRKPVRVVAAVDLASAGRLVRRVDYELALGFVIALAIAGIGGRILARRSIDRVVATVRTLRDFTADAAHELRGPLAALSSNAAASLRDDVELTPAHRKRLETISATTIAMGTTVEDLLLLARAETPLERELFAIELGDRIAAVVDARRAVAAERHISLSFAPFRARIYGSPPEIDRIAGNLIDNALRYTQTDGHVWVEGDTDRSGVTLRVRDTGIGIAAADHARIFERFWRADGVRSREGGTGLGLAIARALVRRHGGDVSVKSAPGEGSEFAVWFPSKPPPTHDISTM